MNAERASNACQGAQFSADYRETLTGLHALQAAQAAVDTAEERVRRAQEMAEMQAEANSPLERVTRLGEAAVACVIVGTKSAESSLPIALIPVYGEGAEGLVFAAGCGTGFVTSLKYGLPGHAWE